jgi:exodeoxyribonuclease VII small subunit
MTEAERQGQAGRPRRDEPSAGAGDPRSFEQLVEELERITDQLAGGELGIEAATDLYEQAQHLHELASTRLAQVQARIDRLRGGPSGATG